MQGAVGSAIATPVEPVTNCLSGRGGDWTYTAQRREARLRTQALRIVAGRQQQLGGTGVADRIARDELGRKVIDDGAE